MRTVVLLLALLLFPASASAWILFSYDDTEADTSFFLINTIPVQMRVVDLGPWDWSQFEVFVWSIDASFPHWWGWTYSEYLDELTSPPANDGQEYFQTPDQAWANPAMSKGEWIFPSGNYQIIVFIAQGGYGTGAADFSAVPEPSTWAMLGLSFLGLGLLRALRPRSRHP